MRNQSVGLAFVVVITMSACSGGDSGPASSLPRSAPSRQASANPFTGESAWIAYQTDRNGEGTWLIHPDGTDDHQIAPAFSGNLLLPNWSPDGEWLVMTSRETGGPEPLYEFNLETEELRQLFECSDPCLGDDEPVYSPDGKKVAFIRALGPFKNDLPSDCGLWVGTLATGKVEQLTSNKACSREYFPHWSPDGSKLTYWREHPAGASRGTAAFVANADGTRERQLTEWKTFAGDPDWSPDGEWIVFNTHPLPAFNFDSVVSNLYRVRPDGSGTEQVTSYESADRRATQPRYTPDGKWILFTAVTPSSRGLSVIPSGGGKPIVITESGIYTHGTWQP